MKIWLKRFVSGVIITAIMMIPAFGANALAAPAKTVETKSAIVGFWIANFDNGRIQYHFHKDGCFHSHVEFNDEVSTFGEGTYTISDNEVTLNFSRRIVDCDNDVKQRVVLQRTAQLDTLKFTVNFAPDGKRWNTNIGAYNVTFFSDEETEAWAEEHVIYFGRAKHTH